MLLAIGDSFTYGEELKNRCNDAWPYILSSSTINLGKGGASNDRIFRLTIEETTKKQYDIVIVCWSFIGRFEIFDKENKQCVNSNYVKQYNWLNEFYEKHYNEDFFFEKLFVQIIALQGYLKSINQKYLFCNVEGLHGNYIKYKSLYNSLLEKIEPIYYIGWPYEGMLDWQGDCPKGNKGHPLELGHKRIAEKIKKHIINLGWENLL